MASLIVSRSNEIDELFKKARDYLSKEHTYLEVKLICNGKDLETIKLKNTIQYLDRFQPKINSSVVSNKDIEEVYNTVKSEKSRQYSKL